MLDRALIDELVDIYFRYIHIAFHNMFHRPSFEESVRDRSIPKVLIYGVISLAARFSKHPSFANIDPRERGRPYAKEAERLLDLHNTSLTTVQACVLMGAIQVVEMDSATESIFYTIACRMAMILDLPNAVARSRLEQELNIRGEKILPSQAAKIPQEQPLLTLLFHSLVWWSVVATDTWSSAALKLPRAIQPRYEVDLPMDERAFAQLTSSDPPCLSGSNPSPAIWYGSSPVAEMIKLNRILHEINVLNAQVASGCLKDQEIQDAVVALSASLETWQSDLPADLRYCPENLSYWANLGFGQLYILLHVNFNHFGQLLFFQFLCQSLAAPSSTLADSYDAYGKNCKRYAAQLCSIIYQAKQNSNTNIVYPLMGHMLVIASTVQIYALLFSGDTNEIDIAKSRLESNFTIISSLEKYWPSLEASSARLSAIHKACLQSQDSSFKLDRWMLRFMQDFARPIGDRESWQGL